MCAYNGLPYIKEAVQCIIDQTYTKWELIISDDGSNDGTREWLKSLQDTRIRLFLQDKNLGYVANKNFAHQQAQGEYITQLDNDDLCTVDRLEQQIAIVRQQPDIKLVATGYHRINNEGKIYSTEQEAGDLIINEFPGTYPFWFPSLLVHRDVFADIGYFDTYFSGLMGDDIYWTFRANEKYPIYFIKDPLYVYRNNPNSITNVYDNKRKLIIIKVIDELFHQRKENRTDWLQEGKLDAIQAFENQLLDNKLFMAEQYRIWAAKAIDKNNWDLSIKLLKLSFSTNPFNLSWYRTFSYYLRQMVMPRNKYS